MELEKIYNPTEVEGRTYQKWLDEGYFNAKVDQKKKPYTIVMPPPNVTGHLHMGHAMDSTVQDVLIRFKRMQGYSALWLPGTDHAAIATEVKVVEAMREEGVTKEQVGRDGFLTRAWAWKEKYGDTITGQLKRMGASCDWDRLSFTMDDHLTKAVNEVFVRLYEKGLIYRGERMINWCPSCKTSLSDAEVEHEEKNSKLWSLRYDLADGSGSIVVSTTRPETMFGDTAVAVNPNDARYQNMVGKMVKLPLTDRLIPIVADDYADMEFGTGAVKITPAHDPNDFLLGARHNLPIISVLNADGTMNEGAGKYQGLDRDIARKQVVLALEETGHLVETKDLVHNVGTCYRCHTVIEPRVSLQWFVKMEPLAQPALEVVRSDKTSFVPPRFAKTYYHWMENIQDWCISRQLWWGHQIPAYYCADCKETIVAAEKPHICPKCGGSSLVRDEDTLDTWFSSALWPFATLGWPDNTADFEYFYPTDVLVTAYDIIFFWVARMIFSGIESTGQTPFHTVFIHGLIRDANGKKMSKSLGNGINPLEVVDKYGADALRFTLASGNSPGNDMRFSEEKLLASRNFTNKIWNAARFVRMNLDENGVEGMPSELTLEDRWIISKLNTLVKEVTENLDRFEIGVALQKLYDFIWDIYCDWYIELTKARLQAGGEASLNAQKVLVYVLIECMKMLHPFMPFLTEEIYQALPHDEASIMISRWPGYRRELEFKVEENAFEQVMEAIRGIRAARTQMNIAPSRKAKVFIETEYPELFQNSEGFFQRLASASSVEAGKKIEVGEALSVVTAIAKIFIPMDELIDKKQELARLEKEKLNTEKDIQLISGKLGNQGFVAKAPPAVVEGEQQKLHIAKEKLEKIKTSIAALEK